MERNKIKIIVCILLFLILLPKSYAIPMPHGIDGYVYDLDGITPACNIDFSVNDTTTAEFIQGKTRANGKYSVSLNGNDGNLIVIKVWNKHNSNNRTITLQGVMHNVNLLLNMSIPELPPNITSKPVINATKGQLYVYQAVAEDENNDILEYSLSTFPDGMIINSSTGLIKWMPTNEQVGNNSITIQVTDGIFYVNQSFIVNVLDINFPPIIESDPITTAYVFRPYRYQVNARDPENDTLDYILLEKPFNMWINKKIGLIRWTPLIRHIGINPIVVEVSDSNLSTVQIFNITVYANKQQNTQSGGNSDAGGSGGGLGSKGLVTSASPEEKIPKESPIEKPSKIIEKATLNNKTIELKARDLPERPAELRGLDKKVYKYLEIKTEDGIKEAEDIKIQFKVEEKWLEENQAKTTDVILNRYVSNKWEMLETSYLSSKDDYVYYEAKTSGFSYFAISLNEIKEPDKIILTGPKEQYIISGVVYQSNRKTQVKKTDLRITNINNEELIETKTGIGNNPGAYYVIIKGNYGDKIDIEVKNGLTYAKISIILTGDMKNIDLVLNNNGLSIITGNVFNNIKQNKKESVIILITVIILTILLYKCKTKIKKISLNKNKQKLNHKKEVNFS